MTGKVKFFNKQRGWGFIQEDNCDAEWFFHFSQSLDVVTQDDKVDFEEGEGREGRPVAIKVKRIK